MPAPMSASTVLAVRSVEASASSVEGMSICPDGSKIAVGRANGVVEILDRFGHTRNLIYVPSGLTVKHATRCLAWMAKDASGSVNRTAAASAAASDSDSSSDDDSDDDEKKKGEQQQQQADANESDKNKKEIDAKNDSSSKSSTTTAFTPAIPTSPRTTEERNDYLLIVAGMGETFYCMDVDTGKEVFSSSSYGGGVWSLSCVGNTILLTTDDGCLKVFERDEMMGDLVLKQSLNGQQALGSTSAEQRIRALSHCVFSSSTASPKSGSVDPCATVCVGDAVGKITKWTRSNANAKYVSAGLMRICTGEDATTGGLTKKAREGDSKKKSHSSNENAHAAMFSQAMIWQLATIDGFRIAAGDSLGHVRIFDARQCVQMQVFHNRHKSEVQTLMFSRKTLVSGGFDGKVQMYHLNHDDQFVIGNAHHPHDCYSIAAMVELGDRRELLRNYYLETSSSTSAKTTSNSTTDSCTTAAEVCLLYGGLDGGLYLSHGTTTRRIAGPFAHYKRKNVAVSGHNSELNSSLVLHADAKTAKADLWHLDYSDLSQSLSEEMVEVDCSRSIDYRPSASALSLKRQRKQPNRDSAKPTKIYQLALEDSSRQLTACATSTRFVALANTKSTRVFDLDLADIEVSMHLQAKKLLSQKSSGGGASTLKFLTESLLAVGAGNRVQLVQLGSSASAHASSKDVDGEDEDMEENDHDEARAEQLAEWTLTRPVHFFSGAREWLAVGEIGCASLRIFNLDTLREHCRVPAVGGTVMACCFHPSKNVVFAVGSSGEYVGYDLDALTLVRSGTLPPLSVLDISGAIFSSSKAAAPMKEKSASSMTADNSTSTSSTSCSSSITKEAPREPDQEASRAASSSMTVLVWGGSGSLFKIDLATGESDPVDQQDEDHEIEDNGSAPAGMNNDGSPASTRTPSEPSNSPVKSDGGDSSSSSANNKRRRISEGKADKENEKETSTTGVIESSTSTGKKTNSAAKATSSPPTATVLHTNFRHLLAFEPVGDVVLALDIPEAVTRKDLPPKVHARARYGRR
ncbi:unnamed protein product [Amoebophrya sp. A25]|nr:unnamed protein product [Amoebophrya sp. A25]|eukprot:GSA25T00003823001.1